MNDNRNRPQSGPQTVGPEELLRMLGIQQSPPVDAQFVALAVAAGAQTILLQVSSQLATEVTRMLESMRNVAVAQIGEVAKQATEQVCAAADVASAQLGETREEFDDDLSRLHRLLQRLEDAVERAEAAAARAEAAAKTAETIAEADEAPTVMGIRPERITEPPASAANGADELPAPPVDEGRYGGDDDVPDSAYEDRPRF